MIFKGRKEENIIKSFNEFYNFNIVYDLILKWVYEEGPFNLNYKWLVNERAEKYESIVKRDFEKIFNISMEDITIL